MSTTPLSLTHVLEATGYFPDGEAAPGLLFGDEAQSARRGRDFSPDALWRSPSSLTVYFKYEEMQPSDVQIAQWRKEIWNEGFAPLLWVISPERIDLYNGFGAPIQNGDAHHNLIRSFLNVETALEEADSLAGRLSMETGQFWTNITVIDRKTSVDHKLLYDLHCLERDLVELELDRAAAQALIGRVIFTQYLIDRAIVTPRLLKTICGATQLPSILRDDDATGQLFGWLSRTFNGDMFPPSAASQTPKNSFLSRVADFLEAVNPATGQTSFFPYRFDVIPVELISSIYEQFAHAESPSPTHASSEAERNGVHYTRLSLVSLVLDEVMDGLSGDESVLDLTCGSGVFLVEALRRLVALKAGINPPNRAMIRDVLYKQVFGVDISETAIRVAAFSLYLAALELDPDPQPPHTLKFQPLIGRTLICGDARSIELIDTSGHQADETDIVKQFDLIVGNPPWSFKGQSGTAARKKNRVLGTPSQPRGEGFDFLLRAVDFSHGKTRFGIILSAIPFFSRSGTGIAAALHVLKLLAPVTLVNLSSLSSWLFATATMPAMILFARHRKSPLDQVTVVQIPWSANGARTHTFEVSPSDINRISLSDLFKTPLKLKAAAVGLRRDIGLLDVMTSSYSSLGRELETLGSELHVGMIRGLPTNQTRDAKEMKGLHLLEVNDFTPFHIPADLPAFGLSKAQWPRSRDIYRAPLLIVKETLNGGPRPVVAVAERDLVYTNSFFGASLPQTHRSSAHLLAAILSSSFASWFFLMSASEFGIWKRRVLRHDVALLPIPELKLALKSEAGKRLVQLARGFNKREADVDDFEELDRAVFDLYELDSVDRVVVEDGLRRASWQWQAGRESSVAYADINLEMVAYAEAFMSVIHGWFSARKKKKIRAEIFSLSGSDPLRVVRFIIEDGKGPSSHRVLRPEGDLKSILERIGGRLHVKIATALTGARELRIHGANEVIVIKPAAARYWMGICGLEDADAVVTESFEGRLG